MLKFNFLILSFLLSLIIVACDVSVNATNLTNEKSKNTSMDLIVEDSSEYLFEKLHPIRTYVSKIDSVNDWSLVLKKDLNFSTEGGEATFYNWNGKLKKITATLYGETFQKHADYYLKNDTLLFVYEKVTQYNRPIYHDSISSKKMGDNEAFDLSESLIIETESYFENGKLIRSIDNQDFGAPYNEAYRNEERTRIFKILEELKSVYASK